MFKIDECAKLVAALKDDLRPKTLKLAFNELKDEGAIVISRFLSRFPTLTSLDLGFNDVGDAGTEALANSLATNSTLKILHLSGNAVTAVGFRFLASALITNTTLTSLYLTGNSGNTGGAAALAESLVLNTSVNLLCFNGNNIKERGAVHISEMLKTNSAITHLNLSDNSIGDGGLKAIADALEANRNIQNLECSFNHITAEGIHSLCVTLYGYTNMKRLLLDNNIIGIKGAQILSQILPSLRLVELNIGFNDIKAEGLISIVKCLVDNTVLESLTLSGNVLDGDVSRLIAYMLVHNTVLRKLYLDRTNMSHSSEKNIAAGIASSKSTSLKTLTGFSLGFVLTTLGSPQKLETYTNDQVLKYLEDMWRLQKRAEIEKIEENKQELNTTARNDRPSGMSGMTVHGPESSRNNCMSDGVDIGNNDVGMSHRGDTGVLLSLAPSSSSPSPITANSESDKVVSACARSDTASSHTTNDHTITTNRSNNSNSNITDCSDDSERNSETRERNATADSYCVDDNTTTTNASSLDSVDRNAIRADQYSLVSASKKNATIVECSLEPHPLDNIRGNVSEHFEGYCEADMMKRFSYAGLCELDSSNQEDKRLSLSAGGLTARGAVEIPDEVECSEELFCLVDSALSDPAVVCVLDLDLKLYYNHSLSYHRLHVDIDSNNTNQSGNSNSPLNCSILNQKLNDISPSEIPIGQCNDDGLYHKNISAIYTRSHDDSLSSSTTKIPSFTSSNFLDKMKKRKLNSYHHETFGTKKGVS